jgi:hypothetical protein
MPARINLSRSDIACMGATAKVLRVDLVGHLVRDESIDRKTRGGKIGQPQGLPLLEICWAAATRGAPTIGLLSIAKAVDHAQHG